MSSSLDVVVPKDEFEEEPEQEGGVIEEFLVKVSIPPALLLSLEIWLLS